VGALGEFWYGQGHYVEGRRWAVSAIEKKAEVPPATRARALRAAGLAYYAHHDQAQAKRCYSEAEAIYRDLGDERNVAWMLIYMGGASIGLPDEYEEAVSLCEEGLASLGALGDEPGVAQALNIIGELARLSGELERAKGVYEECLALSREIGDRRREDMILHNLGFIAQHGGDYERAQAFFREGLALARDLEFDFMIPCCLAGLAGPVGARGQPERGARLIGAAEALFEAMGAGPQPGDRPEYERNVAAVRAQLGEAAFEAAQSEGRAMTAEQAIAYALNEAGAPQ
jgi:tetratricopeptide (TPR) repeat protein